MFSFHQICPYEGGIASLAGLGWQFASGIQCGEEAKLFANIWLRVHPHLESVVNL